MGRRIAARSSGYPQVRSWRLRREAGGEARLHFLSGLTGQGEYTLHYTTTLQRYQRYQRRTPFPFAIGPIPSFFFPLLARLHSLSLTLTLAQVGVSSVAGPRFRQHGSRPRPQRRVQALASHLLLPERACGARAGMERGALWDCAAARGWGSGGARGWARERESERRLGGDEAMRIWGCALRGQGEIEMGGQTERAGWGTCGVGERGG
jgi:hypothetical protein